jgi:hypothetical protein
MEPSEALVALDMGDSHEVKIIEPAERSASKKRKKTTREPETPHGAVERFEDARDTPFTLRKRIKHESSPASPLVKRPRAIVDLRKSRLSAPVAHSEEESEEEFETADEVEDDGLDDQDDDEGEDETESQTISPELDGAFEGQQVTRSLSISEDDSDEDAAPEAISNKAQASRAKAQRNAEVASAKREQEEVKRKRQARDTVLKLQKEKAKTARKPDAVSEVAQGTQEEASDEEQSKALPKKQVIPRMLPDEILNAAPTSLPASVTAMPNQPQAIQRPAQAKHKRFDKEVTNIKRGGVLIKKLAQQRTDLAPKRNASTANTKHQWLYTRNAELKGRRPIKKALV